MPQAGPIPGGACGDGTLQEYIDLGSDGCTIGTASVYGFSFTGLSPIAATDIQVSTVYVNDLFTKHLLSIFFDGPWSIGGSSTLDFEIAYKIDGYSNDPEARVFTIIWLGNSTTSMLPFYMKNNGGNSLRWVNPYFVGPDPALPDADASIGLSATTGIGEEMVLKRLEHHYSQLPEPVTLALTASSLLALGWLRVQRRRRP